jgi:hypothetical protein
MFGGRVHEVARKKASLIWLPYMTADERNPVTADGEIIAKRALGASMKIIPSLADLSQLLGLTS